MVAMCGSAGYRDELIIVGLCSVAQGYSECQRYLMKFALIFFIYGKKNDHLGAFSRL